VQEVFGTLVVVVSSCMIATILVVVLVVVFVVNVTVVRPPDPKSAAAITRDANRMDAANLVYDRLDSFCEGLSFMVVAMSFGVCIHNNFCPNAFELKSLTRPNSPKND
jgi:hypothetical protein